jgi:hypothetical protein
MDGLVVDADAVHAGKAVVEPLRLDAGARFVVAVRRHALVPIVSSLLLLLPIYGLLWPRPDWPYNLVP